MTHPGPRVAKRSRRRGAVRLAVESCAGSHGQVESVMDWAMRYTFHAGYEPPAFAPQFPATLGTADPVAHLRFAAEQGVAGILYPWAQDRPEEEVARVTAALEETRLSSSCILATGGALLFTPVWTDRSESERAVLAAAVEKSCKLAVAMRSEVLAAFVTVDPARQDHERQRDDVVASLGDMARLAGEHGISLGIEPMMVPGLMLQSVPAAVDVVRRVGRSNVGVIYDTAHASVTDGDLMTSFDAAFDHLLLLQFADLPGRVEPGAGELDLIAIAAAAIRRGYSGLVDLEHIWRNAGLQGETDGLERLRRFDAAVAAAAAQGVAAEAVPID